MSKKENGISNEIFESMKAELNGCPLMENRNKMLWDDIAGEDIVISDYYKMDSYYCVVLREYPSNYLFTGQQLTNLLDKYGEDATKVVLTVGKKTRTKNGNTFTPFRLKERL